MGTRSPTGSVAMGERSTSDGTGQSVASFSEASFRRRSMFVCQRSACQFIS